MTSLSSELLSDEEALASVRAGISARQREFDAIQSATLARLEELPPGQDIKGRLLLDQIVAATGADPGLVQVALRSLLLSKRISDPATGRYSKALPS
jgi:hypothetical protein